ncbi:MAG: TIGR04283 family arsenosugar biosynthesis glycosyltransferase [Verrucomicrobia bacterium]|nr:TIGR04283 family arsenosugar biosynthesis glycosyltransferase [Verrucomicrobiota bacterium]
MISIIIPTLNEEKHLPLTLARVHANRTEHEVIVVDAGSMDATAEIGKSAGARVMDSPRAQRAAQMNLGASDAQGDTLLFLHADTLLSDSALERIDGAVQQPEIVGGAFARRYDSNSWFLRATCWLAEMRGRLFGWHLGDQAMFVRRSVFAALGGFREIDLLEDLDFARRLCRRGRVVTLKPFVLSSARRFNRRGAVATTCSDAWVLLRCACGTDPLRSSTIGQK